MNNVNNMNKINSCHETYYQGCEKMSEIQSIEIHNSLSARANEQQLISKEKTKICQNMHLNKSTDFPSSRKVPKIAPNMSQNRQI